MGFRFFLKDTDFAGWFDEGFVRHLSQWVEGLQNELAGLKIVLVVLVSLVILSYIPNPNC